MSHHRRVCQPSMVYQCLSMFIISADLFPKWVIFSISGSLHRPSFGYRMHLWSVGEGFAVAGLSQTGHGVERSWNPSINDWIDGVWRHEMPQTCLFCVFKSECQCLSMFDIHCDLCWVMQIMQICWHLWHLVSSAHVMMAKGALEPLVLCATPVNRQQNILEILLGL